MSHPEITYEEARANIGVLPSLEPRPNSTNLRAMWIDVVDKLTMMPSEQSADHGYSGMVQPEEVYALDSGTPWQEIGNPGPYFEINEDWDEDEREQQERIYEAYKRAFNNQQNVKRAVNDALNIAVPRAYRRSTGYGVKLYRPTDDPRAILNRLNEMYGKMTPQEKTEMERQWSAPWTPPDPVETLFDRLEECYVMALRNKPAYTVEQMLDKAKTAIEATGLFSTALLEWNGAEEEFRRSWVNFKGHFIEAFEVWMTSGGGAQASNGYQGAANATTGQDDDSVTTSIVQSVQQMALAANTNTQALHDAYNSLAQNVAAMQAQQTAFQQQMAANMQAVPTIAPSIAPPSQIFIPPISAPAPMQGAYATGVPPPQTISTVPQWGGGGGGRSSRGGRGRGGGRGGGRGRGRGRSDARYAAQPPVQTHMIPPAQCPPVNNAPQFAQPQQLNYTKKFNNWNMCYSCGWDVPVWHTSKTCQWRKQGHREEVDRKNAQAYLNAGHDVSTKGRHKNKLPADPKPWLA